MHTLGQTLVSNSGARGPPEFWPAGDQGQSRTEDHCNHSPGNTYDPRTSLPRHCRKHPPFVPRTGPCSTRSCRSRRVREAPTARPSTVARATGCRLAGRSRRPDGTPPTRRRSRRVLLLTATMYFVLVSTARHNFKSNLGFLVVPILVVPGLVVSMSAGYQSY